MNRNLPSLVTLVLIIGLLGTLFGVEIAGSDSQIYVRVSGLIEGTDKIVSSDNATYTFIDSIFGKSIVVERDSIVLDGSGYTLQGTAEGTGIYLSNRSSVMIRNVNIRDFGRGIEMYNCSSVNVSGNNVTDNEYGVYLEWQSGNNSISGNNVTNNAIGIFLMNLVHNSTISGNTLVGNPCGIMIDFCTESVVSANEIRESNSAIFLHDADYSSLTSNNVSTSDCGIYIEYGTDKCLISENRITDNENGVEVYYLSRYNTISSNWIARNRNGIYLYWYPTYNHIVRNEITDNDVGVHISGPSHNNALFHNNFVDNTNQVRILDGSINTWDDGYPSGGNYWSNHIGADVHYGPFQNMTGGDGIGETSYTMDNGNKDSHPLINPWSVPKMENASSGNQTCSVSLSSNATLGDFSYDEADHSMSLSLTGESGSQAYCGVIYPQELMNDTLAALVDGTPCGYSIVDNTTHCFLYFTCQPGSGEVIILQTVLGDIGGDRMVDVKDVYTVARAYGSCLEGPDPLGHPWNSICDTNDDGRVGVEDYFTLCKSYGSTYPQQ